MFPYMVIPPLHLGFGTIYPFAVLIVMGILVGYWTMLRRTRRAALNVDRAAALCIWVMVPGLLGAHWFKLLYQPEIVARDPWVMVRILDGIASFGGIAGGLLGAALFFRRQRMTAEEVWRYLDVLACSFLGGWVFGRIGCFLAHDHPGIPSASWLAVRYPGGPRYDLGLLEVFFTLLLLALFRWLDRYPCPPGSYFGVLMVAYPSFRLWVDALHEAPPRYWGISVDQFASVAFLVAGLVILCIVIKRHHRTARLAGEFPSSH